MKRLSAYAPHFAIAFICLLLFAVFYRENFHRFFTAHEAAHLFYAHQSPAWIVRQSLFSVDYPPLYFIVLGFWTLVPQTAGLTGMLFFNLLLFFTALIILYYLLQNIVSSNHAFLMTVFFLFTPPVFLFPALLRVYSLLFLTAAGLAFFSVKILVNRNYDFYNWAGWTLFALLAAYTHTYALGFITLLALLIVWELRDETEIIDCLIAIGSFLALYLPWVLRIAEAPASDMPAHRIPPESYLSGGALTVTLLILAVIAVAYYTGQVKPKKLYLFLFGYLTVTVIFSYLVFIPAEPVDAKKITARLQGLPSSSATIVHTNRESFYLSVYYNSQLKPQFLLGKSGPRVVDFERLAEEHRENNLLFVTSFRYNISNITRALAAEPQFVETLAAGAKRFRLLYFPAASP